MSQLFRVLPPKLFHPFATPGAAIYADILPELLDETQHHHAALSRESVIYHIMSFISNPEALNLTQDAQDDLSDEGDQFQTHAQNLNSKEHQALVQLKSKPLLMDCVEVIQCLIAANCKLEQETVDAERIVKLLAEFDLVPFQRSNA